MSEEDEVDASPNSVRGPSSAANANQGTKKNGPEIVNLRPVLESRATLSKPPPSATRPPHRVERPIVARGLTERAEVNRWEQQDRHERQSRHRPQSGSSSGPPARPQLNGCRADIARRLVARPGHATGQGRVSSRPRGAARPAACRPGRFGATPFPPPGCERGGHARATARLHRLRARSTAMRPRPLARFAIRPRKVRSLPSLSVVRVTCSSARLDRAR